MVAAFFACRSHFDTDGAIYALKTASFYDDAADPFTVNRTAKYRPRHITRRITAQRGLFTIHPQPCLHFQSVIVLMGRISSEFGSFAPMQRSDYFGT